MAVIRKRLEMSIDLDDFDSALRDGQSHDVRHFTLRTFNNSLVSGAVIAYSLEKQTLYLLAYSEDLAHQNKNWAIFIAACAHAITEQLQTLVVPDQKSVGGRTFWGSRSGRAVTSFRFNLIDQPTRIIE